MHENDKDKTRAFLNWDELEQAARKIDQSRAAGQGELPGDPDDKQLQENLRIYQIELEMQNQSLRSTFEELEQSRLKYFRLFDLAPIGYITMDREGIIKEANFKAAEMIGTDRERIRRSRVSLFANVLPDSMSVLKAHLRQVFSLEKADSCLVHCKDPRRGGEQISLRLHTVLDAHSHSQGECFSSITDVTETLRIEETLRDSERRFRYLFEHLSVGALVFGFDVYRNTYVLKDINEVGCLLTKRNKAELVGKNLAKVLPGFASSGMLATMHEAYRANKTAMVEEAYYTDQYNEYWANYSFFRLPQDDVAVMIDEVTDRVRSAEKLKAAMQESKAANEAKSQFLANMSHEIRTPMNVIIGSTELLHDTSLDPEQQEYASIVKDSAEYLLTIVNDILDFSKIEAHHLELKKTVFNLPQELKKVMGSFAVMAEKKRIRLEYAPAGALPEFVTGDFNRVNQVLTNLLSNALNYTLRGTVRVVVEMIDEKAVETGHSVDEGAENAPCWIRFRVRDTGIGIPEDKQHLLFQSFVQLEQPEMSKQDGTGLGLTIAKSLVELMGGKIWFESESGRGSEFGFDLPFVLPAGGEVARFESEEPGKVPGHAGQALKLLLAEDKPINRRLATALLKKLGHSVETAENGREALQMVKDGEFDAVLMDINMPEMDGMEATRLIRKGEDLGVKKNIPIIAMTAFAMKGDREKFLHAGMDGYVSKPFTSEELHAVVERTFSRAGSGQNQGPFRTADRERFVPADIGAMLQKVDGDRELLEELVKLLLADYHQEMAILEEVLARKELEAAARIMHGLKGQFGSLGLSGPFLLAKDIEVMLKKADLERIPPLLTVLRDEVDRLEAFFADPHWADFPGG